MNKLKYLPTLLMALLLGACGSGDDCETTIAGGCGTSGDDPLATSVNAIALISSSAQVNSGGNDPVEITAIVTDEGSGAVSGVNVRFSAGGDAGAILSSSIVETDSAGLARIELSTIDPSNRAIAVTAAVGSVSSPTITVNVVGTALTVTGSESLVINSSAKYSLSLTDSDGRALAGAAVSLESANGNEIVDANGAAINPDTLATDSDGELVFQVNADVPGSDQITASSRGAVFVKNIEVSDDSFAIVSPDQEQEIPLGDVVNVTARWIENNSPVSNVMLNFFSARGTLSSGTAVTNASGEATVMISSTDAGMSEITVADSDGTPSTTIQVEFVAINADRMTLQADLVNVVTDGSTKIKATVYSGGNLVKNKTVVFSLDDPTGGTVSPLTAVTNSNGVATTTYRAGAAPSSTDGVTVDAYVLGTPSVFAEETLTVAGQAYRFDIGTGNEIEELSQTLYGKEWSIVVTDGNSNAVGNSQIQVSAPPLRFRKGYFVWDDDNGVWAAVVEATCDAEDQNRNNQIDAGEDVNGNGRLDPSNVVSVVPIDASSPLDAGCEGVNPAGASSTTVVNTNAGGIARVCLIYNQDKAVWSQIDMTATAGVSGSQSSENVQPWLVGLASDYTNQTIDPPGNPSPYGYLPGCDVSVEDEDALAEPN